MSRQSSIFLLAIVAVFSSLLFRWWPHDESHFTPPPRDTTSTTEPFFRESFLSFSETAIVHSPSIALRNDRKLTAVWYAGSREGAQDVEIFAVTVNPDTHSLSPPRPIITPAITQQNTWRYIRKLGNPVIHALPDGRLMLVYVSVSFGGWAASSLNISFSDDHGATWSKAKRLVTSPFLNISTLGRSAPLAFTNGDVGLPVYHELFGKFSELLILDSNGNIKNKKRISWGRDNIQPAIASLTTSDAITLMRDSGETEKRVFMSSSEDAGKHWSKPIPTSMPNPNASIAVLALNDHQLITVFNNHEDERYDLSLAISDDQGKSWRTAHVIEHKVPRENEIAKFSYPTLIHGDQDDFHLVYTWHKKRIKYIHFNRAWLEQKI
ncbi:MAG: hypothetical protein EP297_07605 [Gammaproteobacteria bacterium]|nr:MAG: hypothetical protein EP297_07605 [Gammaproteobacteria bacterium]